MAFNKFEPFKFWCQKVIPLVYDDSLSYYELLCKVIDYLNATMLEMNNTNEKFEDLYTDFVKLKEYVDNYFDEIEDERIKEFIDEWLDNHPEATTTVMDGAISFNKINDTLKPTIQKATASLVKNCIWTSHSSNALLNGHYNYADRHGNSVEDGRNALKEEIDDLLSMGVEEVFIVVYANRQNGNFYVSGGTAFLNDMVWVANYCNTIGMKCNTFRIMSDTSNSTILTANEMTSYLALVNTVTSAFANYYTNCIVANELESLFATTDGVAFGKQCINLCHAVGMKGSISISNRNILGRELLEYMDFISYNLYQPVQFNTEKIVYADFAFAIEKQRNIFDYYKSFGKPFVISECGCRDCYWSLGNPAGSTVPEGYYNYTYGVAIAQLLNGIFGAIGNDVDKIAVWYSQGFNYHDDTTSTSKCRDVNKTMIRKWKGVRV